MVTLNHIKHKPVGRIASLLIPKTWESIPTCKTEDEEAVDCDTSGVLMSSPHLPSISRTGRDTTTSRLPATWMSIIPTLQVRPLSQRGNTGLWPRPLLHTEMEPSLWPGFAISLRGEKTETRPWRTVAQPVSKTRLYGHTGMPH